MNNQEVDGDSSSCYLLYDLQKHKLIAGASEVVEVDEAEMDEWFAEE